jgi:alkyl sulfatase BDS1-like metallo-beta-lactamase superfamily hydrolase
MTLSRRDFAKLVGLACATLHNLLTLRLTNLGYTMVEIAEMIELPDSLAREWFNRGYYGTVNHDVKAVHQRYIGWCDANPANLAWQKRKRVNLLKEAFS